eukprot:GFKZ01005174.1.p1 GENE.GFKZ01005174.1~~GFKZ01005174.1.p1  ORF type:complete len:132 (+),score=1.33 GFKZ01005174.1:154-549(+)
MRRLFEQMHFSLPSHSWLQEAVPFHAGGPELAPAWPTNIIAYIVSLISQSGAMKDILGSHPLHIARLLAPSYGSIATILDMPPNHRLEGLLQTPDFNLRLAPPTSSTTSSNTCTTPQHVRSRRPIIPLLYT